MGKEAQGGHPEAAARGEPSCLRWCCVLWMPTRTDASCGPAQVVIQAAVGSTILARERCVPRSSLCNVWSSQPDYSSTFAALRPSARTSPPGCTAGTTSAVRPSSSASPCHPTLRADPHAHLRSCTRRDEAPRQAKSRQGAPQGAEHVRPLLSAPPPSALPRGTRLTTPPSSLTSAAASRSRQRRSTPSSAGRRSSARGRRATRRRRPRPRQTWRCATGCCTIGPSRTLHSHGFLRHGLAQSVPPEREPASASSDGRLVRSARTLASRRLKGGKDASCEERDTEARARLGRKTKRGRARVGKR